MVFDLREDALLVENDGRLDVYKRQGLEGAGLEGGLLDLQPAAQEVVERVVAGEEGTVMRRWLNMFLLP